MLFWNMFKWKFFFWVFLVEGDVINFFFLKLVVFLMIGDGDIFDEGLVF